MVLGFLQGQAWENLGASGHWGEIPSLVRIGYFRITFYSLPVRLHLHLAEILHAELGAGR